MLKIFFFNSMERKCVVMMVINLPDRFEKTVGGGGASLFMPNPNP